MKAALELGNEKPSMMMHTYNPSTQEAKAGRSQV
jgi:hypothetical protein